MNFDHRPENLIRGEEFMICATCGAPVGRDRDVEWEHLDEPGRADLLSRGLPKRRTWQGAHEQPIPRSLETLAVYAVTEMGDHIEVTPEEFRTIQNACAEVGTAYGLSTWDAACRDALALAGIIAPPDAEHVSFNRLAVVVQTVPTSDREVHYMDRGPYPDRVLGGDRDER